MFTQDQKDKVLAFLKSHNLAVIATNSPEGRSPEAALVAISETDDGYIVFGTSVETRKAKNIESNPNISFVIGGSIENRHTVQFEGKAVLLEGEEKEKLALAHATKNPGTKKYLNDAKQQYFKVIPTWIRYSNYSASPEEEWEVTF